MKEKWFSQSLPDLHHNENGEVPVGTLLIIGLIVIPLVLVLAIFRSELTTWFIDRWVDVVSETEDF